MNGKRSPSRPPTADRRGQERDDERGGSDTKPDGTAVTRDGPKLQRNGTTQDDDGEASEAETLIDSPVKRREAEKLAKAVNSADRPARHRIGGLPVPTEGEEDGDSAVSPVASTEVGARTTPQPIKAEEADPMDIDEDAKADEDDDEDGSDQLSTPDTSASRASSPSRAGSEQTGISHSSNPRKRKHRASSVGLPNKRQDLDARRRNLRGASHAEDTPLRNGKSTSPKVRSNHRRAVSTQSALIDNGSVADAANRKRRSVTGQPSRDAKSSKAGWEESDASSETTSHDHTEGKMPRRGIGRSTSTPGRPGGREHKRRVNRYGFTKLAEGCENGNLDMVKEWREKDPEQLEIAEFAGNKPLQIAALAGNIEVVDYLIEQGCQIDCANQDKDTPLIDAAENGHLDVVRSLLNAGVDPLRQNLKGRTALDVVKDETDDADQIRMLLRQAIEKWNANGARQQREEEEEQRHRAGPTKELHFMARTYENLMRLVQINDRNGVREFLLARVPVDNAVIAAAAKTGDLYLLNMLLAEMPDKKRFSRPEKPMLSVLGSSHFDMVKSLTELEQFIPTWRDRRGRTWMDLAEERNGPMVREEKELLQKLYDDSKRKERQSSSPVSRRDGGKRRPVQAQSDDEDDSEADVTPRRTGKRRLMSRRERDSRANGRGKSDDDSENESSSSDDSEHRHQQSDPLKKATSSSPQASRTTQRAASSANTTSARRRSSSLRDVDDDVVLPSKAVAKEEPESSSKALSKTENKQARAAEDALSKADERKKTQEAAATAKRRAEEESAAAKKKADEEARLAEEERQEAQRKADEESRRVREEEQRVAAEEARLREQERQEQERAALAYRKHQAAVLGGLPAPIAEILDPESGLDFESSATLAKQVIYHCTPIQVLLRDAEPADSSALWVLNAQVAPLLGPKGLELLLNEGEAGFAGSLAETWDTKPVPTEDHPTMDSLLSSLPQVSFDLVTERAQLQREPSFDEMLQQGAEQLRAIAEAGKRLQTRTASLRYVKWKRVLDDLHPVFHNAEIEVRFDYDQSLATRAAIANGDQRQEAAGADGVGAEIDKSKKRSVQLTASKNSGEMFGHQRRRPLPRRYRGAVCLDAAPLVAEPVVVGRTKVTVIHQK